MRQTTGEEEKEKEIKISQQEWDKVDQFVMPSISKVISSVPLLNVS